MLAQKMEDAGESLKRKNKTFPTQRKFETKFKVGGLQLIFRVFLLQ